MQRVRNTPMQKPDKILRTRPLKEVPRALEKLRRVVLFHKEPISIPKPPEYCVCRKDVDRGKGKTSSMVNCISCHDWFHFDCAGIAEDADLEGVDWKCEWCLDKHDNKGFQRWRTGRGRPKRRHYNDTPKSRGVALGEDARAHFSAEQTWEGKVADIKEMARRAAIKKRKLTDAAEKVMNDQAHHLTDAEGMAGLVARPVDDALVDELVGAGIVNEGDPE